MADTRHILVTGGAGQVGIELSRASWPAGVTLHTPARAQLDLRDRASIEAAFAATPFSAVINCAAHTAVDRAETEVGEAFAANALGPALLADATRDADIPLIQVSTDYVFDGSAAGYYDERDPVAPLGVYGASKLAGELAVRAGNPRSVVMRTAWVVSAHRANFLKTMLRLGADRPLLRVVDDQVGCPTSAKDIAEALKTITLRMLDDGDAPVGVYHFVNAGEASWRQLADEIFVQSAALGGPRPIVEPITTADYPTPAKRPANSRLSTAKIASDFGIEPRDWRTAIKETVGELSQMEKSA